MATTNTNFSINSDHQPARSDHVDNVRSVLRLRVPVAISGIQTSGQSFTELTGTELVSPCGAVVECTRGLCPHQEVLVRFGSKETLARVVGQTGVTERTHSYGIAFVQPDEWFWGVSFAHAAKHRRAMSLKCSSCTRVFSYRVNEIEALVLHANGLLLSHCSGCNKAALCMVAAQPVVEAPEIEHDPSEGQITTMGNSAESAPDPNVLPLASLIDRELYRPTGRSERRRSKRLNLNKARACIERPGSKPDIANVVNISRGGACVRSASVYALGDWIRIACPYTIGGSNIFQQGRIVRVTTEKLYREYGVEYVKTM
jgi:PilZ domain